MKDKQEDELRLALTGDRQRFASALDALKRSAVSPFSLGRHVARSPWIWLLAVAATGALLGLRRANRSLQRGEDGSRR